MIVPKTRNTENFTLKNKTRKDFFNTKFSVKHGMLKSTEKEPIPCA